MRFVPMRRHAPDRFTVISGKICASTVRNNFCVLKRGCHLPCGFNGIASYSCPREVWWIVRDTDVPKATLLLEAEGDAWKAQSLRCSRLE